MEHLPFLVVHGAVVWCLALVILVGGALIRLWWMPRGAARGRRRRILRRWGAPASPAVELDGRTITLAGRVGADGAGRRLVDDGVGVVAGAEMDTGAAISEHAPRLWLEVDRQRVELEGDIRIEAGSLERWPGKPFYGLPSTRSLRTGDAVAARGVLRVVAATGETDYRQPASRFVLKTPSLASQVPPRVRGPALARAVRPTLVAGALFLCVFGAGGALLDELSKKAGSAGGTGGSVEDVLRGQRAAIWMAATPFHRASALERLGRVIDKLGAPSPEVSEATMALADLRRDCGAIEVLVRHRQFRRALERGDSCVDPKGRFLAARAAFLAGEIELASRYLDDDRGANGDGRDSLLAVRVHLLAGQPARASRAARRLADIYSDSVVSFRGGARGGAGPGLGARQLRCMADAIDARAGDAASMVRLQRAAQPPKQEGCVVYVPPNVECQLLFLDLQSGSERAGRLDSILATFGEWTTLALFLSIEGSHGSQPPRLLLASGIFDAARGRLDEISSFSLGLDRSVLAALMVMKKLPSWAEPIRPLLLARSALEESMLLRHDEARRLIGVAAHDVPDGVSGLPDLAPLRAMVELRAGDLTAAGRALEATRPESAELAGHMAGLIAALRRKEPPPEFHDDLVSRQDLAVALRGDGRALAADLARYYDRPSLVGDLALVARWLPRAPLRSYLRFRRWDYTSEFVGLDGALRDLSNLALMAEAIGDRELAHELTTGMRRIRTASQRREIAIPLAMLERL